MSFNKLMWYTIVYVFLAGYVSYSSFVLYELRQSNAALTEMNKIQLDLLAEIEYGITPLQQFNGLTSNRSFSCRIGETIAP
jgi:hypothetical protein